MYINKYYIVSKQSAIIGRPVPWDDPQRPDDGGHSPAEESSPEVRPADISLTEAHERLIDDFLQFTGDGRPPPPVADLSGRFSAASRFSPPRLEVDEADRLTSLLKVIQEIDLTTNKLINEYINKSTIQLINKQIN